MEIEKSILNSLTSTENIEKAWDLGLRTEHFNKGSQNSGIFNFIMSYWMDGKKAPTAEVLKTEFPSFEILEPKETIGWMVSNIQQRFASNQIHEINAKTAELTDQGNPLEALKLLITEGFNVSQKLQDRRSIANLADQENIDTRIARYQERASFQGQVRGAPLGFTEIDEYFFGILPGELATLAGASGTGKSWALLVSAAAAFRAGYRPYVVTLEIPKDDMEDRLDCILSGVPYTQLLAGGLSREEQSALKKVREAVRDADRPLIIDNPPLGERDVPTMAQKAFQAGANYLIIDQLSFVEYTGKVNQLREKYGYIMHDLKSIISSDSDKLSCLIASQFNRAQRKEKNRGDMSNLAESSFVENASDWVFGLTQTSEMRANQAMAFDIMKGRRQGLKSWMLNWELVNHTAFSVSHETEKED